MSQSSKIIRRPAAAGRFYPANPVELARTIAGLFADAPKPSLSDRPLGLIIPHAGVAYAGPLYAGAFKTIEGEAYDTVVILAPAQTAFFSGASVFDGDAYETPLGTIDLDTETIDAIVGLSPSLYRSANGHATGSTRGEHSIELVLPWLQIALGSFTLVPIVFGDTEAEIGLAVGEALAAQLSRRNALVVCATHLTQFKAEREVRQADSELRTVLDGMDQNRLVEFFEKGGEATCPGGLVALTLLARRLSGDQLTVIDYTTSAAMTGEFDEAVGYLTAAVPAGHRARITPSASHLAEQRVKSIAELTADDRSSLAHIAHEAIEARLNGSNYAAPTSTRLDTEFGVFVRLSVNGATREPYGLLRPHQPLPQAVAEIAQHAAFEHPSADPITRSAWPRTEIEVSVVSRLTHFDWRKQALRIGQDGIMIRHDVHQALLLPQEIVAAGWNPQETLEKLSLRAGLPKLGYQSRYADLFTLSTVVC